MQESLTQIRSEAAIYAQDTRFTTDELFTAYRDYAAQEEREGREPDDCQRFFERCTQEG